jgi:hypothetical protein
MSQAPKDTRTPAEKARDTAGIIGSFMHEGYVRLPKPKRSISAQSAGKSPLTSSSNFSVSAL